MDKKITKLFPKNPPISQFAKMEKRMKSEVFTYTPKKCIYKIKKLSTDTFELNVDFPPNSVFHNMRSHRYYRVEKIKDVVYKVIMLNVRSHRNHRVEKIKDVVYKAIMLYGKYPMLKDGDKLCFLGVEHNQLVLDKEDKEYKQAMNTADK